MKIVITINCDNAAFDPPEPEIIRILKMISNKLERNIGEVDGLPLMDFSGNKVGRVELTD